MHGRPSTSKETPINLGDGQAIIFATKGLLENSRISRDGTPVYVMSEGNGKRELVIHP